MSRPILKFRVALLLVLPLLPDPARADAVVTACASDTQAGAGVNLAQALAVGGIVRFSCPPNTVMRITGRYTLAGSTLIEGGDAVTLDGNGIVGPMLQTGPGNVILRRIAVRGFTRPPPSAGIGRALGRPPGTVLNASSDAELDHVTISGSDSPIIVRGNATIADAVFFANQGFAVDIGGIASVERSRFTDNEAALVIGAGWIRSSVFADQRGMAVRVAAMTGPVEIRHSTFTGTRGGAALSLSQRSAPGARTTVTVRANTFSDNKGGAVVLFDMAQEARDRGAAPSTVATLDALPPGGFVLAYNQFLRNSGARGAAIAANLAHTAGMVSTGDLFVGNSAAADGGAVAVSGGALRIAHALFKGNHAGGRGAALAAAGTSVTLADALVVVNAGPAGAVTGDAVAVTNVTIADNDAVGLILEGAGSSVANTILARNRPADCGGVLPNTFRGANLQTADTCPGAQTGDALLDEFWVPAPGSPVLSAGDPALCGAEPVSGFDLVFQARGIAACALGAFEHAPVRRLSRRSDRVLPHAAAEDDFKDADPVLPGPQTETGPIGTTTPGSNP